MKKEYLTLTLPNATISYTKTAKTRVRLIRSAVKLGKPGVPGFIEGVPKLELRISPDGWNIRKWGQIAVDRRQRLTVPLTATRHPNRSDNGFE